MFQNELVMAAAQLCAQGFQILIVAVFVGSKLGIHKPEGAVGHGKVLVDLGSRCNLNMLQGVEHQRAQFGVEVV